MSVLSGCPYYPGVRIIRVSVLSGLSEKKNISDLDFINTKTKAGIFTATKRFGKQKTKDVKLVRA